MDNIQRFSRFFHKIKMKDNNYVIYNSLIMEPLSITENELKFLKNYVINNTNNFENKKNLELLDEVKKNGIISTDSQDVEAYNRLIKCFEDSRSLSVIYFLVTSNCNLACKYCFLEKEDKNKQDKNMSIDIAKIAIEKYICYLKKYNIKNSTIIFYGGEPLINWEIVKTIIKRVTLEKNINFNCTIVTNGTLLTKEINDFLLKHKVNIGISIDGPKEINDKNRIFKSFNGSVYDKVIDIIKNKKNLKQICLSMTLSPDILKNKNEIFEWLKEIGVKFIGYNLYCPTKNELNWEKYGEDSSEFLVESYENLNEHLLDDRIERKIESLTKREFKFTDCGAMGGNQVVIKPDGDICICHGYEKIDKYTIGNIKDIDYDDVLNSEEINFWKKRLPIYTEECLKCEALFCCGGGCPNRSEILFGERKEIDKVFCIHTKRILHWYLEKIFMEE